MVAARRSTLVLAALCLGGCAAITDRLEPVRPLANPPASAAEAITNARAIADAGRWQEAIAYLDAAALSIADKQALLRARDGLEQTWQTSRRTLEDRMLAGDAENQRLRIELLEQISLADPDDARVTARRIDARRQLQERQVDLVSCAETHVEAEPDLARRCFALASGLDVDAVLARRLAGVEERLQVLAAVDDERRKANERSRRHAQARALLDKARAAIKAQDYRLALDTLDRVARLQPNNPEIAGLKREAVSLLTPQVKALVRLGDHLYLDEQLDAAIATWQAALTLQPDDVEIQARIDRAVTVLENLEALRQRRDAGEPQR